MALTQEDCRGYLESLGMGPALVDRGLEVVAGVERFLPDRAEHVFVSEWRDEEGGRRFDSLWLLGPGFMSEAHRFVGESGFDVAPVKEIARVLVEPQGFDFVGAGEDARLSVTLSYGSCGCQLIGLLRATGSNCVALTAILERYLVPLLAAA